MAKFVLLPHCSTTTPSIAFAGSYEYRIVRTKEQVAELQSKMAEGKYDQPELDDVIASLGKVVADNRSARVIATS
jgi:hypothetical protein